MEAETQTEEEQVNIIEPSDPITPMGIEILLLALILWTLMLKLKTMKELEQTLLEQLKIAKSVAEAKQFCTTDLDDFDFFE